LPDGDCGEKEKEEKIMRRLVVLVGGILAIVLSWIVNQSIIWAFLHFWCGWIYVIYWALTKTDIYSWLESLVR